MIRTPSFDSLLTLDWPAAAAIHREHFCAAVEHGDEDAALDELQSALISERMADLAVAPLAGDDPGRNPNEAPASAGTERSFP